MPYAFVGWIRTMFRGRPQRWQAVCQATSESVGHAEGWCRDRLEAKAGWDRTATLLVLPEGVRPAEPLPERAPPGFEDVDDDEDGVA